MYAIVEVAGMQYKVSAKDTVRVPKINEEAGKTVQFDQVLLLVDKTDVQVGKPQVANAKVKATVLSHGKDKKVMVFKKKRRKDYKVKKGHRQEFTEIRIDAISFAKSAPKKTAETKTEAKPKAEPKPASEQKADKTAAKSEAVEKSAAKPKEKPKAKKADSKPKTPKKEKKG